MPRLNESHMWTIALDEMPSAAVHGTENVRCGCGSIPVHTHEVKKHGTHYRVWTCNACGDMIVVIAPVA